MTRWDLLRVFWRGLWLQGSWSYSDLQTLGFAHALEPVLRRRHRDVEQCRELARYLEFFNTNPIMASAIIGAVVHAEIHAGEGASAHAHRIRGALMGPYGALGDSFFWGAARPCAAVLALVAAASGASWAPWVLVGLFGGVNLGARGLFFTLGVRRGIDVVGSMQRLDLLRWADRLRALTAGLLGVFAAAAVPFSYWQDIGVPAVAGGVLVVSASLAWSLVVRRGGGPTPSLAALTLVALGSAWLT